MARSLLSIVRIRAAFILCLPGGREAERAIPPSAACASTYPLRRCPSSPMPQLCTQAPGPHPVGMVNPMARPEMASIVLGALSQLVSHPHHLVRGKAAPGRQRSPVAGTRRASLGLPFPRLCHLATKHNVLVSFHSSK
ncbi:hypothetical protein BDY21DRAFT_356911 [Lineolata rhizophorae]|uniref:Uncharacterized protein n=1 Tax=Lineolata rhizophorae TaxID=578093 RepID=A0A6A6NNI9_9PEZI|nr:hypothetical protein BDY21DRAFT_356911 [Lineolata rhizophorae]